MTQLVDAILLLALLVHNVTAQGSFDAIHFLDSTVDVATKNG